MIVFRDVYKNSFGAVLGENSGQEGLGENSRRGTRDNERK